jgi:hypothetical protein
MKHFLITPLVVFLFLSCGSSQKLAYQYLTEDEPIVYRVNIKLRYIPPYCGGAAPSEQMEQERLKGFPWNNKVFYMNKNDSGKYESFVSDQYGMLRLALFKGKYCLKLPYKVESGSIEKFKKQGWEFDAACLEEVMNQCDFSFEINSDTTLNFTHRGRCHYQGPTPCVTNPGPPPP